MLRFLPKNTMRWTITVMVLFNAFLANTEANSIAQQMDLASTERQLSKANFDYSVGQLQSFYSDSDELRLHNEVKRFSEASSEDPALEFADVSESSGLKRVSQQIDELCYSRSRNALGVLSVESQVVVQAQPGPVEVVSSATSEVSDKVGSLGDSAALPLPQVPAVIDVPGQQPSARNEAAPLFVEAFDRDMTPVEGVSARMLSSEKANGQFDRGLGFAQEESQHWSTVDWFDPAETGVQPIPLVGMNSLRYIAAIGGVNSQSEQTGFIFGKIARGWDVSYSDVSEKTVYLYARDVLDQNGNISHRQGTVIEEDMTGQVTEERYYVILNVMPGARALKISSQMGEGEASIPVPIFSATGFHADLTQISKRTFSGQVFRDHNGEELADSTGTYSLTNDHLSIEVSGQTAGQAILDSVTDEFEIKNVLVVGSYPFYVHVKHPNRAGEIHQYRVFPSEMRGYTVYLISSAKIEQWLSQVQHVGSLSQNITVVAVPSLVKAYAPQELHPRLDSWAQPEKKRHQVYTVYPWTQMDSPYDEVKSDLALGDIGDKRTRFFGFSDSGLALPSVRDEAGRVLWSELTLTIPIPNNHSRFVNIVGPY